MLRTLFITLVALANTVLCPAAWASTVLISVPQTSYESFATALVSQVSAESWGDVALRNLREQSLQKKLADRFARARALELAGQTDEALSLYESIAEDRLGADWGDADRKIIVMALVKLAQYATLESARSAYLRDSQIFSGEHWTALKRTTEIERQSVQWVLVNGRKMDALHAEVPSGLFRITFLTNWALPETMVTDKGKLENLKLTLTPLVRGRCANGFQWKPLKPPSSLLKDASLYVVAPECMFALQKASGGNQAPAAASVAASQRRVRPRNVFSETPKWVWVGLGILGGLALLQQNQSGGGDSPTTKRGF